MSYVHGPNPELEFEAVRAREQELEAKAECYAATHPDDGGSASSPSLLRRLVNLVRRTGP
jgi:hypothetical protein